MLLAEGMTKAATKTKEETTETTEAEAPKPVLKPSKVDIQKLQVDDEVEAHHTAVGARECRAVEGEALPLEALQVGLVVVSDA